MESTEIGVGAFAQKMGGHAMSTAGVGRIEQRFVEDTIKYVSDIVNIPKEELHPLGSTGKSPTSGDVDLCVDVSKFDPLEIHQRMVDVLGLEHSTFNKGTKIGSYAVPIAGDTSNGLVQVDLMFVDSVEWAKFAYFSAGLKNTKYKGVVRTILIRSLASVLNVPGIELFVYDYGVSSDLMIRIGRTVDLNSGLRRIVQYRPKKQRGNGYLANLKTITLTELKTLFPDLDIGEYDNLKTVNNPQEVLNLLFDFPVDPTEVETAEQVVKLVKKFPEDKLNRYIIKASQSLKESVKFTDEQLDDLWRGV